MGHNLLCHRVRVDDRLVDNRFVHQLPGSTQERHFGSEDATGARERLPKKSHSRPLDTETGIRHCNRAHSQTESGLPSLSACKEPWPGSPPPHHIPKSLNHSLLGSRRGAILGVRHEVCTIAAGLGGRTWPSHAWARNWEHGSFRVSAYS